MKLIYYFTKILYKITKKKTSKYQNIKNKTEKPWLYMIIMLLMYAIHLILDRIRMNNLFHFYIFQIHLFYQNIAINILKLQKKLLLISVERDSNNRHRIATI